MTQERGNLVLWNMRQNAQNTDPPEDEAEQAEEERREEDPLVETGDIRILVDNMRADLNIALANGRFDESNQIQTGIMTLLDASAGPRPEGLSENVMQRIRGLFQRVYRVHRNRGSDERAERYLQYVEDMNSMMQR